MKMMKVKELMMMKMKKMMLMKMKEVMLKKMLMMIRRRWTPAQVSYKLCLCDK